MNKYVCDRILIRKTVKIYNSIIFISHFVGRKVYTVLCVCCTYLPCCQSNFHCGSKTKIFVCHIGWKWVEIGRPETKYSRWQCKHIHIYGIQTKSNDDGIQLISNEVYNSWNWSLRKLRDIKLSWLNLKKRNETKKHFKKRKPNVTLNIEN